MNIFLVITGSPGTAVSKRAIDVLSENHSLIVSSTEQGKRAFFEECGIELYDFLRRKQRVVKYSDKTLDTIDSMLVLPCSAGFVGKLAAGCIDDDALFAADHILATKKKIVLALGEPVLSAVTLKNLQNLATLGACVCPITSNFSDLDTLEKRSDAVLSQLLKFCDIKTLI